MAVESWPGNSQRLAALLAEKVRRRTPGAVEAPRQQDESRLKYGTTRIEIPPLAADAGRYGFGCK